MGTRKEFFYKSLIIDDEDRIRAEQYLTSKGVEKHIIIKEKLLNWMEGNEIEYSMIASTYRYDKRLRIILFKYISYLEEFYRAVILDAYRFSSRRINWIDDVKEKLIDYNWNLNDALERIEFSTLLKQVSCFSPKIRKRCCFPYDNNTPQNTTALKELRNAVMHNKFLLLYRGFEICYVNGVDGGKSANLKANILNLLNYLPNNVAENCKKEINNAKNEGNNNGTKWNLPGVILIEL